jgi:phytoene dehydrogenase-like protein
MMKTTKNAVGEFLGQSATSKVGPGRATRPEFPAESAGGAMAAEPAADIADIIMTHLTARKEATPEDMVRDLGLPIGDALTVLAQLEQFGFVRRREDGGKTILFLP